MACFEQRVYGIFVPFFNDTNSSPGQSRFSRAAAAARNYTTDTCAAIYAAVSSSWLKFENDEMSN